MTAGMRIGEGGGPVPEEAGPAALREQEARAQRRLTDVASLLAPLGATAVRGSDHAGADVTPLVRQGVLGLGLEVDDRSYLDTHHTEADTLDNVDPQALADGGAAVAVMAYVLADLPEPVHRPAPSASP